MVVEGVLGRAEIVDLEILSVLVKVLFALNVKDWSSQILELSSRLWHLEFLGDLHDLLELR